MKSSGSPEEYIEKNPEWKKELSVLRNILLSTELDENIKWGVPVYSLGGKNVVGIAAFKNHLALWFYNGVYLEDPKKVLINANKENTRGLRQWRFKSIEEIDRKAIERYVFEAIANQRKGIEIKPKKTPLEIPQLLKVALANDKELKAAFDSFTAGKQKEFANYISEAKREQTQISRLEKCIPLIREGVGLHDKYRK